MIENRSGILGVLLSTMLTLMNHLKIWIGVCLLASVASDAEIEPTWESLAEHYRVPDWFVDGKIGVWMHWGIVTLMGSDGAEGQDRVSARFGVEAGRH